MKKIVSCLLALLLTFSLASCGEKQPEAPDMEPEVSQMKAICELAVMDCYYHNVAKFKQEDAEGFLFWKKDKNFWIEYSGVVTLGVDVSQVTMEVNGTEVTISMPAARVLNCKVDSASLTKDSFIVASGSAAVTAEDEVAAFDAAQSSLQETAANDTVLLANAQQRAQSLLEDYVINVGKVVGKEYTVRWVYLDDENGSTAAPVSDAPSSAPSAPAESAAAGQ